MIKIMRSTLTLWGPVTTLFLCASALPAAAETTYVYEGPGGKLSQAYQTISPDFDMWTLPNNVVTNGLEEEKVYVNQGTVATGVDLTGSIGANDGAEEAWWRTTDEYGLDGVGNGFAVIKGGVNPDTGENELLHDISFGVYNSVFEDVIFSVIPDNQQVINFIVTGHFQDGTTDSVELSTSNGLEDWLALVREPGNLFTMINITSNDGFFVTGNCERDGSCEPTDGGFTQTKQWEVSGVTAVPLPAAAWLFGSALFGMVGIGYRRSRRG